MPPRAHSSGGTETNRKHAGTRSMALTRVRWLDVAVSGNRGNRGPSTVERPDPQQRSPRPLLVAAALVALESLGTLVLTVVLLVSLAGATPGSVDVGSSIALALTVLVAALLLGFVAYGLLRAAKWARPAALVWQLVQLLVGFDATQGVGARPDLAALLIVPALVVLVLLFTPSVSAVMRRER